MKFTEKLIAFEQEIKDYFLSKVKDGEKVEFIASEDISDDDWNVMEFPQVTSENKYNEVVCYSIIAIERSGETINLYGYGLGEYLGQSYIFSFYEIPTNELCFIADYLK